MEIVAAEFTGSFPRLEDCPKKEVPEYAFIGRSNVGKSTLINMMCNRKQLAKTSVTPGKTQLLNYFWINDSWFLVDLPGYGYAKVSKTMRIKWEKMVRKYLVQRLNLKCVFLLIDGSIPTQKIDLEFANWLGEMQVPFVIVFTKIDRLAKNKRKIHTEAFCEALLETWEELPPQFTTSSKDKVGKDEILSLIDTTNKAAIAASKQ